jgi:hypothetical protein
VSIKRAWMFEKLEESRRMASWTRCKMHEMRNPYRIVFVYCMFDLVQRARPKVVGMSLSARFLVTSITHKTKVQASERAQVRRKRAGPTAAAGYGPIYALNCHFAYIFVPDVPVAPLPAVPGVCLHFRDSTPIFFDRQLIPYTSATNLVSMDLWLSPAHLWPVEMLHTPPGPIEDAPVKNSGG